MLEDAYMFMPKCKCRWGLFNPSGVGPFDIDIDDEIGRSGDFFDEENE